MGKLENDIYFEENYSKLYENIENGETKVFKLNCEYGEIESIFIKRKIDFYKKEEIYDITTPYGYGGPRIVWADDDNKDKLIEEYERRFGEFCKKENIIAEFIRFHPIIKNSDDFKNIYYIEKNRITLGTNLSRFDDPVSNEFSKSCRKKIRRALKAGIKFEVDEKLASLDDFIKVYYSTMDRNNASEFYYFDKQYFKKCIEYFPNNIIIVKAILDEVTIAAGFYFIVNDIIHIHLSGTLDKYLYLSPAYILRYAVTLWGKEKGYKLIHHGGGRTNSEDDGLYKFKKNFSKHTEFDFYIGKKIWNLDLYKEICDLKNVNYEDEYFPAYRK